MTKYLATLAGLMLAVAFVVVFFIGRTETRRLTEVAPAIGVSHDDLLAMGPRIATSSGATLGTARHVVYLLACSGLATPATLESQATRASALARQQRLTDREAIVALLAGDGATAPTDKLKGC